jgi:hypothetical protein
MVVDTSFYSHSNSNFHKPYVTEIVNKAIFVSGTEERLVD